VFLQPRELSLDWTSARLIPELCGGFRRLGILISFATGFDCGAYAGGLITHQVLAALDEIFPLCTAAIHYLAPASDVLIHLFLALVDHLANLLGSLTAAGSQILGAFTSSLGNIFSRFPAGLGSVENADQSAYAQSSQKPCHALNFASIIAHNFLSFMFGIQET
jgi:hypothetical protein